MLAHGAHTWLIVFSLLDTTLITIGLVIGIMVKIRYAHLRTAMLEAIREQYERQNGAPEVDVVDLRVVSKG